ncbi:hypothetical protein C0584_02425 [Candidatus Parcubacteria bacterium]|nr:MAG: hypothetical protein C0584_02425 [Candidatus Parcubacteria bacterium]
MFLASFFLLLAKIFSIFREYFLKYIFSFVSYILKSIFKLFFHKALVKIYSFYLSITNKIGWEKIRGNFLNFIFGQKLVHVVVVFLTVLLVFTNLTKGTSAGVLNEGSPKPMIAYVVGSEFGEIENELYFEEALGTDELDIALKQNYLDERTVLKNNLGVDPNIQEEQEVVLLQTEPEEETEIKKVAVQQNIPKRTETIEYIVESGDTVSTIARKFDISVNTILWENNLSSYSLIRPGDELSILPESGISYTIKSGDTLSGISRANDAELKDILDANNLSLSSSLKVGQKLVIPGGSKIVQTATIASTQKVYSGIEAIKNIVTPSAPKTAANKMAWPTVGNRITQYYSWRHKGLDIANKTGTPLFAADSGTIEFVGWSNGYGYNILINHGGGKKTRYAHMSKFYVEKNDEVGKGEAIGEMGSTGWSTGPHIHFEVIIDGVKYNPLNYIR